MKYKVGDVVTIRKDLIRNEEYGGNFFLLGMEDCKGKKAKIMAVRPEYYDIDIDGGFFAWTDEMFEETDTREEITWDNLQPDDVVTDRDGDSPSYVIAVTKKGFLTVEENEEFPYFTTFEEAREMNWKIKQPNHPEKKQTEVIVERLMRDIEDLTGKKVLIVECE
jgi:hypothetical protein